jgi:5-methylcytosine-specific restriction enzyme subunit McrC
MREPLRVYEHECIQAGKTPGFERRHLNALIRFNERPSNYNKYFTLSYNGIRFKEYVRVIQADDLTIEVLPKADKTSGEKDKTLWRNVLLEMLKTCKLLQVQHLDNANLLLKQNSLLEVYCQLFLNECDRLYHEGLVKKYRFKESNNLSLKGQLLFAENIRSNLVHAERFYTRSQSYDCNNTFNRILYTTLQAIPKISTIAATHFFSYNLANAFPELMRIAADEKTFINLKYDRKTERYREAMFISQLLLLNFRPDIRGGEQDIIAIMFDMNELWEEYVYRKLKKEESRFNIKVSRQEKDKFWWNADANINKHIRPDIVIRSNNQQRKPVIVDTKWKILSEMVPSDEDLKQMYVYNLFWGTSKSVLVYPSASDKVYLNTGKYYHHIYKGQLDTECLVLKINVLDENHSLDKNIGAKLLSKMQNKPLIVPDIVAKYF